MCAEVTVVGLGCELDRLFAGQPPALPMPAGAPGRDELRDLFDALNGPLRGGKSVVVIVGDWLPQGTIERVRVVHSLLQSDRVVIYITPLPPLAASVLAALSAALAPYAVSAGALAGALDTIAARLWVLAWAGSVAGLRHPDVSVLHHARSALPWTSFGIGLQPDSFVRPVAGGDGELPLALPDMALSLLIAPGENADLSWVLDTLAPALGGPPINELPPTLNGAHWWGTSRLVEVVGIPASLDALAASALPTAVWPCAWCEEPIAVSPCPLCGDERGPRVRRGGSVTPDMHREG
jgi:hypothetical protein